MRLWSMTASFQCPHSKGWKLYDKRTARKGAYTEERAYPENVLSGQTNHRRECVERAPKVVVERHERTLTHLSQRESGAPQWLIPPPDIGRRTRTSVASRLPGKLSHRPGTRLISGESFDALVAGLVSWCCRLGKQSARQLKAEGIVLTRYKDGGRTEPEASLLYRNHQDRETERSSTSAYHRIKPLCV